MLNILVSAKVELDWLFVISRPEPSQRFCLVIEREAYRGLGHKGFEMPDKGF